MFTLANSTWEKLLTQNITHKIIICTLKQTKKSLVAAYSQFLIIYKPIFNAHLFPRLLNFPCGSPSALY